MQVKPEVVEKVFSFLGIENVEDAEKFQQEFNGKFVPLAEAHAYPDVAGRVLGRRMGEITSRLAEFGKTFGMDVTFDQLKEKKVEDVLTMYTDTLKTKFTELQDASKSGTDKRINDLAKALEDKEKTYLQYKEQLEKLSGEYDAFKQESANNIKSFKINHQLEDLKGRIAWVDGINDVQRVGFDTLLKSNYVFDLDEAGKLLVKDKGGNLIPKKDKAGAFSEPADILDMLADMNGLKKKNNADNNKKSVTFVAKPKEGEADKHVSSAYRKRLPR